MSTFIKKKTKEVINGQGWYEIEMTEDVGLVVYTDAAYWGAHKRVPESNIIDGGEYFGDGLSWFRYSKSMTKDQYEESCYKTAQKCNCVDCYNKVIAYETKYGIKHTQSEEQV